MSFHYLITVLNISFAGVTYLTVIAIFTALVDVVRTFLSEILE